MKLAIAEYLRSLKERDELDRLLPDLLLEMGYVPIAKPQTGNRQFGVDLAARRADPKSGNKELLLLVIKQGDIGRAEWDGSNQSVRQSINEIFDVYLRSHVEPQDQDATVRIVVATNGELKQVIYASWCGFVDEKKEKAEIAFWGNDSLADLVEQHLLDEHVFLDEDRKDLRRALALSGDSDYDRRDLYRLFRRKLGLTSEGQLIEPAQSRKELIKALRVVSLSAHMFVSWSLNDGDARQGLQAKERALLWIWHRIQLCEVAAEKEALISVFGSLWTGYLATAKGYFERVQGHCYVEDGLLGYAGHGAEISVIAFELIGLIATIGLSQILVGSDGRHSEAQIQNAETIADALFGLIKNNGICNSPCLDRHSQDITLAITLLILSGKLDEAKQWLTKLIRNIDYAYKAKKYVPIGTDSLDDLASNSGWTGEHAEDHLMQCSWTLAVLAGWAAILRMDDHYEVIARGCRDSYPEVFVQLWHPDLNWQKHLYFSQAQYLCGASEAPIKLPQRAEEWRGAIRVILNSSQANIFNTSTAAVFGVLALDMLASRHFATPLQPYFWYQFLDAIPSEAAAENSEIHSS